MEIRQIHENMECQQAADYLEALNSQRWNLLDELQELDVARAALMNYIKDHIPVQRDRTVEDFGGSVL